MTASNVFDPLHGNHLARIVTWRSRAEIGMLAARTLHLAFRLRAVKIYAVQFVQ